MRQTWRHLRHIANGTCRGCTADCFRHLKHAAGDMNPQLYIIRAAAAVARWIGAAVHCADTPSAQCTAPEPGPNRGAACWCGERNVFTTSRDVYY